MAVQQCPVDIRVADFSLAPGMAADREVGNTQCLQRVAHGPGGTPVAQHQGSANSGRGGEGMGGSEAGDKFQQRLAETPGVRVVAPQQWASVRRTFHPHAVHGPDGGGFRRECRQQGDNLLLVGNRHVKADEVGMLLQESPDLVDILQLETVIPGIDAFPPELVPEVPGRERVPQRPADNPVTLAHARLMCPLHLLADVFDAHDEQEAEQAHPDGFRQQCLGGRRGDIVQPAGQFLHDEA